MNANLKYEIMAKAFEQMTGYMAPGKDQGVGGSTVSMKERQVVWNGWLLRHGAGVVAGFEAYEWAHDEGMTDCEFNEELHRALKHQ